MLCMVNLFFNKKDITAILHSWSSISTLTSLNFCFSTFKGFFIKTESNGNFKFSTIRYLEPDLTPFVFYMFDTFFDWHKSGLEAWFFVVWHYFKWKHEAHFIICLLAPKILVFLFSIRDDLLEHNFANHLHTGISRLNWHCKRENICSGFDL